VLGAPGGNGSGGDGVSDHCRTCAGGGYGATVLAAGAGGQSDTGQPGSGGVGPVGGNGYTATPNDGGGGGGGGGYYGGGGGAFTLNWAVWGAGGGGGSSFVANPFTVTYGNDTTATPSVTITYTPKLRKV
jgi:hypothetical protein